MTNAVDMNFEAFKALYLATFSKMMSYKLTEVGSNIYMEKLVDLADAHPEWVELLEAE